MLKGLLALAATAALALAGPAYAAPAADANMFAGKTITYIVSTGPGGGYDTYGRLTARYMQKYLPGSRFVVKNVPGAGHIVGANTISAARPDGLTIGTFNTGLVYDQLLKRPGVRFDLTKMSWIGKASNDTRAVMVSKKSTYKSFDEILQAKAPVKFAASGIGSAAYIETRILQDALHVPIQIVPGYNGNEAELAMLRNEVAAEIGTANSLEQFVANGNGYFALTISETADLPTVPKATAYAKDDRSKKLVALVSTLSHIGRLTVGPPGIPPATLAVLRQALTSALKDQEFLAEAKKLDLPIVPADGAQVDNLIKQILNQSPETIAYLNHAAS